MDVFPKFIIETDEVEGDVMIIAKCTYHRELASDKDKVKGGGWWTLDRDKSVFTLHGSSDDFGKASIEDMVSCVQNKKVFSSFALVRNLTDNYTFEYRNEYGEIIDLDSYEVD